MTSDQPANGPETTSEFEESLGLLISHASNNGIDIEGGYAIRNEDAEPPDWGVEIYEVTKSGRPLIEIG